MQLLPEIQTKRHCIWLPKQSTLVIGDIHIGYDEELNTKGILIPRVHTDDIFQEIQKTLQTITPKKIILIGDIKHEFGRISEEEWRHTLKLIDLLAEKAELILIKGNHDTILGPIAEKRNITIKDSHTQKNILFLHGHQLPQKIPPQTDTIIIGHEHPAIKLNDGIRTEHYKCFLVGTWKNYNLVVLPSINTLIQGTDILTEKLLSPFLTKINNFNVYVVGADDTLNFGKVKNLVHQ